MLHVSVAALSCGCRCMVQQRAEAETLFASPNRVRVIAYPTYIRNIKFCA
jgi:hypothetical protein